MNILKLSQMLMIILTMATSTLAQPKTNYKFDFGSRKVEKYGLMDKNIDFLIFIL
jgi:hypothetical protein